MVDTLTGGLYQLLVYHYFWHFNLAAYMMCLDYTNISELRMVCFKNLDTINQEYYGSNPNETNQQNYIPYVYKGKKRYGREVGDRHKYHWSQCKRSQKVEQHTNFSGIPLTKRGYNDRKLFPRSVQNYTSVWWGG